mgnify:CR=1 FL=1
MTHRTQHAFSAVELLVVIAIISVLAAMLFPSIGQALDQARRLQCMQQQRQIHQAASAYACDYRGYLGGGTMIGAGTGGYRIDANQGNVLHFFGVYLDVPLYYRNATTVGKPATLNGQVVAPSELVADVAATGAYALGNLASRGVLQCPGNTDADGTRLSYALYGFASVWYTQVAPGGYPRMERMATRYHGYPKVFSMDSLYLIEATEAYAAYRYGSANNHSSRDPQGANVTAGDGSIDWVGAEECAMPLWDWGVPRWYWLKYSCNTTFNRVFSPESGARVNVYDMSVF